MTLTHKRISERDQLDLFRALPGDLAPRDAQDLMAYPFFSLAKSKRVRPIDYRTRTVAIRVEAVPDHLAAAVIQRQAQVAAVPHPGFAPPEAASARQPAPQGRSLRR